MAKVKMLGSLLYLSLDPDTANNFIELNETRKGAKRSAEDQKYPTNPLRFDNLPQVLCKEKVDGKKKWSIKWGGKEIWIGVAYGSIQRKGDGSTNHLGGNPNSWALHCTQSSCEVLHNNNPTPISQRSFDKIGIDIDTERGALSFYGIEDGEVFLHTFNCTFTESVYAGFKLGENAEFTFLA